MNKSGIDMCHGPLFKKIILFTVPIILTSILQLLFNAADLVVVGRYCGSVSVAAVGATASLTNLFINFFIGFSTGTGVTVSHAIGSGDDKGVNRAVHTAIPIALICGGILSVLGLFMSEPVLALMDTPDNVLKLSALYMKIYFGGMIFNMVYNYGASILRAAGDTKSPLYFLTFAGVLNVGLNIVFVTVVHMNVAGVALATVISQAVSAILVVTQLMRRQDAVKLDIRKLRIYPEPLKKILLIGFPSGIQSSLFSISNTIIQSSVNSFGDTAISGCSAAHNIEGFLYVIMNSFSHTSLNFTSQNVGARKYDRVKKTFVICLLCTATVGIVGGLLIYTFAVPLLSIYIKDSAEAISYGVMRITVIVLTYFLCGIMEATTGSIRGMGYSFIPMAISVFCVCVMRVFWVFSVFRIPRFHSIIGLLVSYPISWLLAFLCEIIVFIIIYNKKKRLV